MQKKSSTTIKRKPVPAVKDIQKELNQKIVDDGLLFEINRKVLHPYGLALAFDTENKTLSIQDNSDDLEGMIFGEEDFREGTQKYNSFLSREGRKRQNARLKAIGFITQQKGIKP